MRAACHHPPAGIGPMPVPEIFDHNGEGAE